MKCGVLVLVWLSAQGSAPTAIAADNPSSIRAEALRGAEAVGSQTSDEPALRLERQGRAASDAFVLGAAFAAWRNAAAGLDYDVAHPAGDGGEAGVIINDCLDERLAFGQLEQARQTLGLTPQEVMTASGLPAEAVASWSVRRQGAASACR